MKRQETPCAVTSAIIRIKLASGGTSKGGRQINRLQCHSGPNGTDRILLSASEREGAFLFVPPNFRGSVPVS